MHQALSFGNRLLMLFYIRMRTNLIHLLLAWLRDLSRLIADVVLWRSKFLSCFLLLHLFLVLIIELIHLGLEAHRLRYINLLIEPLFVVHCLLVAQRILKTAVHFLSTLNRLSVILMAHLPAMRLRQVILKTHGWVLMCIPRRVRQGKEMIASLRLRTQVLREVGRRRLIERASMLLVNLVLVLLQISKMLKALLSSLSHFDFGVIIYNSIKYLHLFLLIIPDCHLK